MIQIKHDIGEDVYYFNDVTQKVERDEVSGIHVVPNEATGRYTIFYQLKSGLNIPNEAAFSGMDECISYYAALFGAM